jgi:hypothetical protein
MGDLFLFAEKEVLCSVIDQNTCRRANIRSR